MTTPINGKRRKFISGASSVAAISMVGALSACSDYESPQRTPPQFTYGVASGDPLTDRVILWTYAK